MNLGHTIQQLLWRVQILPEDSESLLPNNNLALPFWSGGLNFTTIPMVHQKEKWSNNKSFNSSYSVVERSIHL